MSQTASIWLVILLALAGANLPFLSQRLLGLMPLAQPKSLPVRLAELVAMYFICLLYTSPSPRD